MSDQKRTWPVPGDAALPISNVVNAGGLVYVAGQVAVDERGRWVGGADVKAQTRQALHNVAQALDRAGTSLAQAASINVYLKRAADFVAMNEVYAGSFPTAPPARTTIVADLMDDEALVEIAAVALPKGAPREVIHPKEWITSPNPYSYGIRSGDQLFLSGLVARNGRDNSVVEGDMTAQTKVVLENAREILHQAGLSFADVVTARAYITDVAAFQDMNAVYRTAFASAPPARATVVCELMNPGYQVEITLFAVKGERRVLTTPNADGSPGRANPNLSSAVRVGNRLFLSGMLGNTEATRGDAGAQAREAIARLGRTLKAADFGWGDVVDGVVYLTDASDFAAMNTAWREVFASAPPARATVRTRLVAPDGLVEIMLTAVK
jgi:enamine deaminase RidA (YjgF/YER057c/UK114 family)